MNLICCDALGMPHAYAPDLRERRLRAETAGRSAAEIKRITDVSISNLNRWRVRVDGGESPAPGHAPGRALLIGPDQ
jgi:transposase